MPRQGQAMGFNDNDNKDTWGTKGSGASSMTMHGLFTAMERTKPRLIFLEQSFFWIGDQGSFFLIPNGTCKGRITVCYREIWLIGEEIGDL